MTTDVAYNFIVPGFNSSTQMESLRDWRIFNDGRYCWSALSYLQLRSRMGKVNISDMACSNSINIAHARTWSEMDVPGNVFIVSCQADWPRLPWAHFHIVQNKCQLGRAYTTWVPHWPQLGLRPRSDCTEGIRTVAYFGRVDNAAKFDGFRDLLESSGLNFIIRGEKSWNDYSDIDVAISLRFLHPYRIRRKPPSKLINAWLAGVPFIAMEEPAFSQIGTNGEDYIGLKTPEEVVDAVLSLRNRQDLYQRLVKHGKRKAAEYGWEAIAERWLALFDGPIIGRFEAWQRHPICEAAHFEFCHKGWSLLTYTRRAALKLSGP